MIKQQWLSENRKFCLFITIVSPTKEKREFRVVASDIKPNSKYADRVIMVEGTRDIYLSFPVSPKQLAITIMDKNKPLATDFEVIFKETRLRDSLMGLDADTKSFVQMAIVVSQTLGFTPPRNYESSDGLYRINVYDVIKDQASGKIMSTPARIGHTTGTIEVSKVKMDSYTIPMRMIILLHEFSHKYKNPKMGLDINNEVGADVSALYIYMGLGFSKVDCIYVFCQVFLKAQTPDNIKRIRIIMDYIKKYENKQNLL